MRNFKSFFFILTMLCSFVTWAQVPEAKENNQHNFKDIMYRQGSAYRTASGKPGSEYWQNSANYTIEVSLDDKTHMITGNIEIEYTNNSPESLDFIWLYLEQNRFTEDSRGILTTPMQGNRYNGDLEGGYTVSNFSAKANGTTSNKYLINDTRMQVFLDKPVKANGGKATVKMDFSYKIPVEGMDRMGRLDVEQGTIYALAQWFPKVAVFDDVVGWNTDPYLGAGEFYVDYGNYDYKITAPYNHTVVGSGVLQNPKEVLTKKQLKRWEKAQKSDETVYIIEPDEVGKKSSFVKNNGSLTWHFKMDNTRDVAFASSPAFIWDAARMNLSKDKTGLAQSVYPKESDGQEAWSRSTEYTKASVEFYSKNYFEYPYVNAINVAAEVGGMEYPGVSFCSWKSKGSSLWGVTDHEFGHNWFPMIVGSNERRYAWMDEGFNTFINHYSTLAFNDGEYPSRVGSVRILKSYLTNEKREGIDNYPDVTNLRNLGYTAYYKPAAGLIMLREYILGEERFDYAFKSYIKTWAYKHPQPSDFFNHMENATGEDLAWFWKGWFYGTDNIDIAVKDVEKKENGYLIKVEKVAEIPMPVKLLVKMKDGSSKLIDLPVEIWQRGDTWEHFMATNGEIKSVEFDPQKKVSDVDGSNDRWEK
ncbi:M1 family metallopeptidase [Mesonia ostreae]|uniref:M1 family metallopeptidase n=1 Tax=Mesonia ostreae TaxID=861110 RepID=A0ABU2KG30_9FLAO|nr:M1 family metallopeptidase [Mesonia ostreae]MDT0293618.1 M1 family metallopeptidase [Mesonia ostreae]